MNTKSFDLKNIQRRIFCSLFLDPQVKENVLHSLDQCSDDQLMRILHVLDELERKEKDAFRAILSDPVLKKNVHQHLIHFEKQESMNEEKNDRQGEEVIIQELEQSLNTV